MGIPIPNMVYPIMQSNFFRHPASYQWRFLTLNTSLKFQQCHTHGAFKTCEYENFKIRRATLSLQQLSISSYKAHTHIIITAIFRSASSQQMLTDDWQRLFVWLKAFPDTNQELTVVPQTRQQISAVKWAEVHHIIRIRRRGIAV